LRSSSWRRSEALWWRFATGRTKSQKKFVHGPRHAATKSGGSNRCVLALSAGPDALRCRSPALTTANFRPRAGATLAAPSDRRAKLRLEADATSNTPSPDLSCVVQALDAWWDQPPLFPHTDQFGRGSHASSADSTNIPCTYDSLSRRLPTSYIHYSAVTPTHATVIGTWG
jgi:hypothetical protein